ncbi:spore germination protein [Paenibacillus sp. HWE-109]|uniref:spore germination protein n=1 Tax=Paenibacillus sp. HWE-109 TaxID=1306526 RepID=UPI001EDF58FD|nr:spore germination protein [Paenibacillus sp. HWE-109]UKS23838.1 spore germination protein [Paenibacillus sp. HWE-109]
MQRNDSYQNASSIYDCENMQDFVGQIMHILHEPPDLVVHSLVISSDIQSLCVFIDTVADRDKIEHELLHFLTDKTLLSDLESSDNLIHELQGRIPFSFISSSSDLKVCIDSLLNGSCLLLLSQANQVLIINASQTSNRTVSEPQTESTVRGPQEGFTEDIAINLSLLRKRVKNVHLHIEQITKGTETKTTINMIFLGNLAPVEIVDEFRQRLASIEIDSVLDSAYIEEWIQDRTYSPFKTLLDTERPDIVASHLLEGRIAVLIDGSPIALIGPITFFQFFIAPDDYYQRADVASLLRLLRILSFMLSVFVPSLYIAVVSYHQELLPHSLLISIAAQREGVPFPAFMEAFIMMVTFELLREAGLRMPRIAGQAISIVGALVLGQAAVSAGLVSTAMVIVVAITAISNFVMPSYSFAITQRLLQFFFMILAGTMGLFGVLCGALFTIVHLASIKSFNISYLSPLAPISLSDWKDSLVRVPRPWMKTYPRLNRAKRKRSGGT